MKKSEIFKKFLKEAVREVIHEEVRSIIREELANTKPLITEQITTRRNFDEFLPGFNKKPQQQKTVTKIPSNPIEKILMETAKNMSGEEMRKIANVGPVVTKNVTPAYSSSPIQNFNPQMMESIGEIEDWLPSTVNLPDFPIK